MRGRKGQSTIIATMLIAVALLLFVSQIYLGILSSTNQLSSSYSYLTRYTDLYNELDVVVATQGDSVTLINTGTRPVHVDYLVVRTESGIEAISPTYCTNLGIMEECSESIRGELLSIITKEGVIIYPEIMAVTTELANSTLIVPINFNVINTADLTKNFDTPEDLVRHASATQHPLTLRGISSPKHVLLAAQGHDWSNAEVRTKSEGIPFGTAIIGYDVSWLRERNNNRGIEPRYSLLLAGPKLVQAKVYVGGKAVPLSGGAGFRIKILNFTGTIEILNVSKTKNGQTTTTVIACSSSFEGACPDNVLSAIGTWYYGLTSSENWELHIVLDGVASNITLYTRVAKGASNVQQTSYDPYLFFGDIDGNYVPDMILITEDYTYGTYYSIDDGEDNLLDYSTAPLPLVLKQIGQALGTSGYIDGRRFAGITLFLNIYFHDDSYPDIYQLNDIDKNEWIMRITLIDEENRTYVIREYRYQEIANYHKSVITDFWNDRYFVKISQTIFVPLPGNHRYWVVIELRDPYLRDGYLNDADITVGIEYIGALPLYRG